MHTWRRGLLKLKCRPLERESTTHLLVDQRGRPSWVWDLDLWGGGPAGWCWCLWGYPVSLILLQLRNWKPNAAAAMRKNSCCLNEDVLLRWCSQKQETDKKPTGESPFFLLHPCTLPLAPPISRAEQEASW